MATAVPAQGPRLARPRLLGLLVGAAVAVLVVVLLTGSHGSAAPGPRALPRPVDAAGLLDSVGSRVVRVSASGFNGLIDVRYQVADADKASVIHDAKYPPALVDERSGQVIGRLLMGHSHSGAFRAGVTYATVFENPGGLVRPGDRVSVVLGPVRLQHVVVQ